MSVRWLLSVPKGFTGVMKILRDSVRVDKQFMRVSGTFKALQGISGDIKWLKLVLGCLRRV